MGLAAPIRVIFSLLQERLVPWVCGLTAALASVRTRMWAYELECYAYVGHTAGMREMMASLTYPGYARNREYVAYREYAESRSRQIHTTARYEPQFT